jgi:hypothetical protein
LVARKQATENRSYSLAAENRLMLISTATEILVAP